MTVATKRKIVATLFGGFALSPALAATITLQQGVSPTNLLPGDTTGKPTLSITYSVPEPAGLAFVAAASAM